MMIITNKNNPKVAVNTNLVTDYYAGEYSGKPSICFGFPAATQEDSLYAIWTFDSEDERDTVFNNIMEINSAMQV